MKRRLELDDTLRGIVSFSLLACHRLSLGPAERVNNPLGEARGVQVGISSVDGDVTTGATHAAEHKAAAFVFVGQSIFALHIHST